jgi:hypothetical protein
LDKRLGGPQIRSGCGGEEKNSQTPSGKAQGKLYLFFFYLSPEMYEEHDTEAVQKEVIIVLSRTGRHRIKTIN